MRFAFRWRWQRAPRRGRLRLEPLEDRTLPAGPALATTLPLGLAAFSPAMVGAPPGNLSLGRAQPIDLNSQVSATVGAGQVEWFRLVVPSGTGRLTARVVAGAGSALAPRLALHDDGGHLLLQYDGSAPPGPGAEVVQHLRPGT